MASLVGVELAKLRRHGILWLAAAGAAAPVALALLWHHAARGQFQVTAERFITQVMLNLLLLEGPAGAAIIGSVLFGREHGERTLANLLLCPVPRGAWMGAKWIALALLGTAVAAACWGLAVASAVVVMGSRALSAGLLVGSAAAFLAGAASLYATSAIAVAITLGARNPMAGVGWGVAATMGAVLALNSRYGLLFPGSLPFFAGLLALEAAHPPAVSGGVSAGAQFAWMGLPAGPVAGAAALGVWAAGVAFSVWQVNHADVS